MENLSKAEIRKKVIEMLDAGRSKTEVFDTLSGGVVGDRVLAYWIAGHVPPALDVQHDGKVNILITIMFIQTVIAVLLGYAVGVKIGPNAAWVVAAVSAAIPLLILYGFYKNNVGAYNAYLILTFIEAPNLFKGFAAAPLATAISIAVTLCILAFIWYVRSLLFPDFLFLSPKKVKGKYVFSS